MTSLTRRPEATGYSVERIVAEALDGRIRVPHFQRPLRWSSSDVIALFDSIHRGFPIGEFLLARREADADRISIGPVVIDAAKRSDCLWVVDGQQRITALVASLSRQEPSPTGDLWSIWYDLLGHTFHRNQHRAGNEPENWIPLSVTLDSAKLMHWCMEHLMRRDKGELFDAAVSLGKAIREFQIPAYIVEGADEKALRLIFTRSNSSGAPMKESEVFDALYQGSSDHPIRDAINGLTSLGWGTIDHELFLRCIKLTRSAQKSSIETMVEGLETGAVESMADAFVVAISVMREAGFRSVKLLPYRLPLIGLVLLAHRFGSPSPRAVRLAKFWVWRGSLGGDLSHSNHAMTESIQSVIDECTDWESTLQRLLELLSPIGLLDDTKTGLTHDPRAELRREISLGRATVKMFVTFLLDVFDQSSDSHDGSTGLNFPLDEHPLYTSPWPQRPIQVCDAVLSNWSPDFAESQGWNPSTVGYPFGLDKACLEAVRDGDVGAFRQARDVFLREKLTDYLNRQIGAPDELRVSIHQIAQAGGTTSSSAP